MVYMKYPLLKLMLRPCLSILKCVCLFHSGIIWKKGNVC